jgi:hypothetical protein
MIRAYHPQTRATFRDWLAVYRIQEGAVMFLPFALVGIALRIL